MRPAHVYSGSSFSSLYTYTGDDLGVVYTPETTQFRLWAPTAATANVLLYDMGQPMEDESPRSVPMLRDAKGTWVVRAEGDMKGRFYTYQVQLDGKWHEAVDPYAAAVGLNGQRGKIVDLRATDPMGWEDDRRVKTAAATDAIIYELHVRDLSAQKHSGIRHKGKFLGLAEAGTSSPDGLSTGLDHISELGVTHVHLLPIYDFRFDTEGDNPYNWGYNPVNYNAPEDSYATNPIDGVSAIRELKKAVQALHSRGIGVVMDVVFNHTFETGTSNFDLIVPGYFYRIRPDGTYSNGSGCGNETASERAMVRKFIVDSVVYWAKEYHLDGFRFDIMGLHDTETMNEVRKALDKIDPRILTYGEGWIGGDTLLPPTERATKDNTHALDPRIGMFSDDMRDGIRGSHSDARVPGFVNGDPERSGDVRFGIVASTQHHQVHIDSVTHSNWFWAQQPSQTINFNSCHDDLTLWDKLIKTCPTASTRELTAMNRLAAFLILTSQGVAFLHAGEEMARTKDGNPNTYHSPDSVNQLDWLRKAEFHELFAYYQGLIRLRRACPLFRMRTADEIRKRLNFLETPSPSVIAYTLSDDAGQAQAAVLVNSGDDTFTLGLPDEGWSVVVDGERAGAEPLYVVREQLDLDPKSAYVLLKNPQITQIPESEEYKFETADTPEELPVTESVPPREQLSKIIAFSVEPSKLPLGKIALGALGALGAIAAIIGFARRKK
ncbi:hypothetical protein FACS1894208_10920 [Clostridia bacterium]|nr:hypothetical protein FACS1894208_10920 [Clostridia bacterium]